MGGTSKQGLTHITPDVEALKEVKGKTLPFSLTPEDYTFFQSRADENFKNKVKIQLFKKLDKAPNEQKELIVGTVDGVFDYIKARNEGRLLSFDDCFTLSLLVILWGNSTREILKGPVMNEPLLQLAIE